MGAMWRVTMYLLCLIAALSGTPLRQAEAADDLARSIDTPGHLAVIELMDGGVGDEAEASLLKTGGTHPLSSTAAPPMAAFAFTPQVLPSSPRDDGDHRRLNP